MLVTHDIDSYVWVRTDNELAGPYDSVHEAVLDHTDQLPPHQRETVMLALRILPGDWHITHHYGDGIIRISESTGDPYHQLAAFVHRDGKLGRYHTRASMDACVRLRADMENATCA